MKRDFGVPEDKAQDNFTDPESRIMNSSSEGFIQAYNAQLAVEENSQLIVTTGVTQNAADNGELIGLVEKAKGISGQAPAVVLADSGYKGEKNFEQLESQNIDGYISLGREGKQSSFKPTEDSPATKRMHQKLQSATGKKCYKRRKAIVEPVYGWIKEVLGFRRFSFRGLAKVSAEWELVCLAVNLKRLHAMVALI